MVFRVFYFIIEILEPCCDADRFFLKEMLTDI
jgi:hypothetical protein